MQITAAAALVGCSKPDSFPDVASLEARIKKLESTVDSLQSEVEWASTFGKLDQIAYLTPGSDGYSPIKMDLGYLTVSLANIRPYANGSKVALVFGNLTSATVNGLKATIEWGSVDAKGMPQNEAAKSREVKLPEDLLSGAWNKTEVVLEGVLPEALGFVRLRDISHQGIRLRGRPD
jgi:hypothetical protein